MSPTRTPKCAIYARVSTEDQTCRSQLDELRAYCERRNWPVYGEYVDLGWSGAKRDRPQLGKLLDAARKHMFDKVLVWKLDRFGRSVANLMECIDLLTSAGVTFMCISQSIDTAEENPASRLQLQILAAVAEFERSMIRERVKAGLKAAVKRGAKLGRRRTITDSKRDKILELHLRGKSSRQIATELGIHFTTVCRLLPKAA
jgi:DNA invertase Pin-like site-specific DNA recombinase